MGNGGMRLFGADWIFWGLSPSTRLVKIGVKGVPSCSASIFHSMPVEFIKGIDRYSRALKVLLLTSFFSQNCVNFVCVGKLRGNRLYHMRMASNLLENL